MAAIKSFEEIKAWQEGRALARLVYAVAKKGVFARDFGFKDQIQRAVVSINSNIAEGFERDSNPEFVKFLGYAKGSAGEVLSQAITAYDIGYLSDDDFDAIAEKARFIGLLISRLRDSIIDSDVPGPRWKKPRASSTSQPRNFPT